MGRRAAALALPALLAGGMVAASLALAAPARAEEVTLQGAVLTVTLNSSNDIRIATDPALSGAVRLTGDHISCLSTHDGMGAASVNDSGCGSDLDGAVITVPPSMPLTLTMNGSGEVTLGDMDGPVTAAIHGSGDLKGGRAGVLTLTVNGSGDAGFRDVHGFVSVTQTGDGTVKIEHASGVLHAQVSGSGDLAIGAVDLAASDFSLDGSGDVTVGGGSVGVLHGRVSHSGDLIIGATATAADLTASGGGDIRVARVTGPVTRHVANGSDIETESGAATGIGALTKFAVSLDDEGGSGSQRHHRNSGGEIFHHILAAAFLLFVLYLLWRMVKKRGGVAVVRARMAAGPQPGAPTHPGVVAVSETLARLDKRLARVESYVTEREFELNRKFRDLEARP